MTVRRAFWWFALVLLLGLSSQGCALLRKPGDGSLIRLWVHSNTPKEAGEDVREKRVEAARYLRKKLRNRLRREGFAVRFVRYAVDAPGAYTLAVNLGRLGHGNELILFGARVLKEVIGVGTGNNNTGRRVARTPVRAAKSVAGAQVGAEYRLTHPERGVLAEGRHHVVSGKDWEAAASKVARKVTKDVVVPFETR